MFWRNYLVFILIATLLISVFSTWLLYETIQKERNKAVQITSDLAQTVDQWLSTSQRMSASVGQIEKLLDLADYGSEEMDFSQLDAVLLSQVQHSLVAAGAMEYNISHLAVYLYNREYVITDTGTLELDEFYQTLFAAPAIPQSDYLRPLPAGKFLFIREGAVGNVIPGSPVFVTSVIDTHGKQYGNLFVFWDPRRVSEALKEIAGEQAYYFIYDADGNSMFCSDSRFLLEGDTLALLKDSGENPTILSISAFSGWRIYAGLPVAFLHQRLWRLGFLMIAVWGAVLFIGWFITMALCKKNYAPISELARSLSTQTHDELSQEMEYEALVAVISSITDSKKNAEEQVQIYKPVIINSLLLELFDGTQEHQVTLNALHAMGCSFPYAFWQCVAVAGDGFRHDTIMALTEEMRQDGDEFVCYTAIHSRHSCVFLLNASTDASLTMAASKLYQILERTPAVHAYGTSDKTTSVDMLGNAYHQAYDALNYTALDNWSKGCEWKALLESGVFRLHQPDGLSQLFAAFSFGRISEAKEFIQEYFAKTVYNGYSSKEHLRFLHSTMLSCVKRLETEYKLSFCYEQLQQWNADAPNAVRSLYQRVLDTCDSIQTAMEEGRFTAQNEPTVLSYLNDHLFDENLSLTALAEYFGVSESVVSRKIRSMTNFNFLDYVNKKRIEHAAILLLSTDISVNDLSKTVGYGSDITFRRLFKKYMGITPSEYRRKPRGENRLQNSNQSLQSIGDNGDPV